MSILLSPDVYHTLLCNNRKLVLMWRLEMPVDTHGTKTHIWQKYTQSYDLMSLLY